MLGQTAYIIKQKRMSYFCQQKGKHMLFGAQTFLHQPAVQRPILAGAAT
jgi:hypothetical protein